MSFHQVFLFPFKAVAKGRPRVTRFGTYTPAPTRRFEAACRAVMRQKYVGNPLEGPLRVTIQFIFMRPPSQGSPRARGYRAYPHGRPDLENLVKGCLDAANGILWVDDSQVCGLYCSKVYGPTDHFTMSVETLDV